MMSSGREALCALALLISIISCQRVQPDAVINDGGAGERVFTAGFGTRTSVAFNEGTHKYAISWEAGDAVSIFDGTANRCFTAQTAGSSTTLTGAAADAGVYYALYPYSAGASMSGTVVSTAIPSEVAVAADGGSAFANLSAAKTSGTALNFSTVAGVLRLNLDAAAIGVSEIRIIAIGGESLAGSVAIDMAGSPSLSVVSGQSTISLTPATGSTFAAGHSYYVAAAPGTLASGVRLEFDTASGTVTRTNAKPLTISAGAVMNLGTVSSLQNQPTDGYAPAGYSLVWTDEFDDEDTLESKWMFEVGGGGWGNNEQQYYCADGVAPGGARTAEIADDVLRITARKVKASSATDNRSYVSARMYTKDKWKYGYIEMKARLPEQLGTWSAFWMLPDRAKYPSWVGDSSCKGGELDIMEYVPGDDPTVVYFSAHSYNATTSAGDDSGYTHPQTHVKYPFWTSGTVSNPGDWHCYGMEWTHEYVKAYIDGVQYYYAPNPSPNYVTPDANPDWGFDKEFYIKLNLAMGGSWGGSIPSGFTTATYEIDWVRVYQ